MSDKNVTSEINAVSIPAASSFSTQRKVKHGQVGCRLAGRTRPRTWVRLPPACASQT